MDFENFCKNSENLKKAEDIKKNLDPNYEKLIDKYKNKSTDELYSELIRVAKIEQEKGTLNKEQLINIYNNLLPMMNEEEKSKIKNLIEIIGK